MDNFISFVFLLVAIFIFLSIATFIVTGKSLLYRAVESKYTNHYLKILENESKWAWRLSYANSLKMFKLLKAGKIQNQGSIRTTSVWDVFDYFRVTRNPKIFISAWPDKSGKNVDSSVALITDDGELVGYGFSDERYQHIEIKWILVNYYFRNKPLTDLQKLINNVAKDEERIRNLAEEADRNY
jgi:hypothetical protein